MLVLCGVCEYEGFNGFMWVIGYSLEMLVSIVLFFSQISPLDVGYHN